MKVDLASIAGSIVSEVEVITSGWTDGAWIIVECKKFMITIQCPWRFIVKNTFQFGWIENKDFEMILQKSLIGKKIFSCIVLSNKDLRIEFEGGRVLEVFSTSKSSEQWRIEHLDSRSILENSGGSELWNTGEWIL